MHNIEQNPTTKNFKCEHLKGQEDSHFGNEWFTIHKNEKVIVKFIFYIYRTRKLLRWRERITKSKEDKESS